MAADAGISAVANGWRFRENFAAGSREEETVTPLEFVGNDEWSAWLAAQDEATRRWIGVRKKGTQAGRVKVTVVPTFEGADAGEVGKVVVALKCDRGARCADGVMWDVAAVVQALPKGGVYQVVRDAGIEAENFELGFALGAYSFTTYKSSKGKANGDEGSADTNGAKTRLLRLTDDGDSMRKHVDSAAYATYMVRDMISTPAEDLGPANIEAAFSALAAAHGARSTSIVGEQLLRHGYPQVHRVGRAATPERAPRLLELVWNDSAKQTVTLVGKGVCYDSGGLSIKPTASMVNMKKDMGGAAHVLGLGAMIMEAKLDVRLRILVPAVENNIDASAYRPGDILTARNGMTTLNVNSDAEGRLILADALIAASEEENVALIIECATLTGAARVALGTDVPAIFCDSDDIANRVFDMSRKLDDLLWRMPLHAPYRKLLDTSLADIKSCSSGGTGGAITAALYLKEFVGDVPWIHVDMNGFNVTSSPGRPEGGEAMGIRALFGYLHERFGTRTQ